MVPETIEKPQVTEIQVRMDCNGCVQKIKKALHGINGKRIRIYDLYIDFPQQKLTIIGWADPEKIIKAIRKTRKVATICSHTEPTEQPAAQSTEQPQQAPEGGTAPPSSDAPNPPPAEAPPAEAAPAPAPAPAEPLKDVPPPQNPPAEEKPSPSPAAADANASQSAPPAGPKDVGEVHVIHHHPPDYGYRYGYGHNYGGQWNRYANSQGFAPEQPQPIYVTQSHNTYRPSPYVTEYQYIHSPPQRTHYSRMDYCNEDYHENSNNNRNGNITSMFSDENPNACRIV